MPTINVPITSAGSVRDSNPDTWYNPSSFFSLGKSAGLTLYELYFKIDESVLLNKFIISATLHMVVDVSTSTTADYVPFLSVVNESFNPSSVTWNTRPSTSYTQQLLGIASGFVGAVSRDVTLALRNRTGEGFGITTPSNNNLANVDGTGIPTGPYLVIEYSNIYPYPPSLLYPDGVTVDRAKDLTLQWGGPQHLNSEIVWNDGSDHVVSVPGNTFEYTIPGGTMLATNVTWKVRMEYPEAGWSEFSNEVLFVSADAPSAPVITTTAITSNLPTIEWTSVNQTAFNIKISSAEGLVVDYTKYVSDLSYTLTQELLDATEYTIELSIQDTTGLWSAYDVEVITSNFPKPDAPTFVLTNLVDHAQVAITNGLNTAYNEIMKLIDSEYVALKSTLEDETVNVYELISGKLETLKVRAYRDGGGYADSATQTITVTVDDSHLITYDESIEISLAKTPSKSNGYSQDAVKTEFVGRSLPVAIVGEIKENEPTWSFETFDLSDIDTLKSMIGVKTLFRDKRGFIGWFVITKLSFNDLRNSTIMSIRSAIEVNR